MFWVYILENSAGKFYVGQTNDLDRRVKDHNLPSDGSGKYSRKKWPLADSLVRRTFNTLISGDS